MNAAEQTRRALAAEQAIRTRRGALSMLMLFALVGTYIFVLGAQPITAGRIALTAVGAGLSALAFVMAVKPGLHIPFVGLVVIAIALIAAPLASIGQSAMELTWECAAAIASVGLVAMVGTSLIERSTRRRFGGGPEIAAMAAAGASMIAVGWCCPGAHPVHLLTHSAGVLALVGLTFMARKIT